MLVGELKDLLEDLDENAVVLVNYGHVQFVEFEEARARPRSIRSKCPCKVPSCTGTIVEFEDVDCPPTVMIGSRGNEVGITDLEPGVRLYGPGWSRDLREQFHG